MKTLGQIAYDAAAKVVKDAGWIPPAPYSSLDYPWQDAYKAAASAIVEECAKVADEHARLSQVIVDNNADDPLTRGHFSAVASEGASIAKSIRSLSSPKAEE